MSAYDELKKTLVTTPKKWVVTGAGGFIGSHLVEALLKLNQEVVGLDNFATGRRENLCEVQSTIGEESWRRFTFFEADVCDAEACRRACAGVDIVLHQAALGSVPRSLTNPMATHVTNTSGFLTVLAAARDAQARFVFASSSSVYGDSTALPKVEDELGAPLSPYAATKLIDEMYAGVFARCYGVETIGLRYFNVFGPRQDPQGAYAAVIPKWIAALLEGQPITINGDGETSRDFCFIENVVQANLLAGTCTNPEALNRAYNVGLGTQTTLNQLFSSLRSAIAPSAPEAVYKGFRAADVRHSRADISRARDLLGYNPQWTVEQGLGATVEYYRAKIRRMTSSMGTS